MSFQATPLNVITVLLIAFALYVLYFLSQQKLDSNLPVVFYIAVAAFAHFSELQVNTYLVAGGLILALLLRFEFMNSGFTKALLLMEMLAITGIAINFVATVFV